MDLLGFRTCTTHRVAIKSPCESFCPHSFLLALYTEKFMFTTGCVHYSKLIQCLLKPTLFVGICHAVLKLYFLVLQLFALEEIAVCLLQLSAGCLFSGSS